MCSVLFVDGQHLPADPGTSVPQRPKVKFVIVEFSLPRKASICHIDAKVPHDELLQCNYIDIVTEVWPACEIRPQRSSHTHIR